MPGANGVYNSAANGAYIADGGDTTERQAFYKAVWTLTFLN